MSAVFLIRKFLFQITNRWIRKRKFISRYLFGVNIIHENRLHWDFTTLALKNCLLEEVGPQKKVLEIGTGPHSILSLFLARHIKCDITATDINESYVNCARETADYNHVTINFIRSDLFENIDGRFDVIFWNSVYIPRDTGLSLGVDRIHKSETDWCGGNTGIEKIMEFLKSAPEHLKANGKILLGFNRFYLSEESVAGLCKACGYEIDHICGKFINPSLVIVLHRSGRQRKL